MRNFLNEYSVDILMANYGSKTLHFFKVTLLNVIYLNIVSLYQSKWDFILFTRIMLLLDEILIKQYNKLFISCKSLLKWEGVDFALVGVCHRYSSTKWGVAKLLLQLIIGFLK